MTAGRSRVVFDCNLFLQAAISSGGSAAACLDLIDEGAITLILSPDVVAEMRDVLTRPKLARKFATLTPERVERFLNRVEALAEMVSDVPRVIELPRDPKDEPYINLAVAADARYLVSRDKDLLDFATAEASPTNLTILDPVAFLQELAPERRRSGERAPGREPGVRNVDPV